MSDHLIVVSADCHAGLPIADYKPYVESKYHEMMDMAVPITCLLYTSDAADE